MSNIGTEISIYHKNSKKALIVAVSTYDDLKPLNFCENDGQEMFSVLKDLGYDIPNSRKLIGKIDSETLRTIVHDFFINEDTRADDTMLFYYSGHGVMDIEGDVYLAPSDLEPNTPLRKGFPFYYVTKLMNMCTSTRIVTILDCCYSGAAKLKGDEDAESKQSTSNIIEKSKVLKQGHGKCLLAASQGYQEAVSLQEKNHSLYTFYLLEGLKGDKQAVNAFGNVTVSTLNGFVYEQVTDPTHKLKQQPVSKFELSGDIVLARYPTVYTLLKEGNVKEFNIMKKNHANLALVKIDLSRLDLHEIDLSEVDLTDAMLSGANLSGAKLDNAVLSGAKLDNAVLSGAKLDLSDLSRISGEDIRMESTSLIRTKIANSYLYRANLRGAKLNHANLWRTTLDGADLSNADFSQAELSNTVCSTANFHDANLSNADLSHSHLWSANLSGANLSGANLSGANLSGANLSGANLANALLLDCQGFTTITCETADFDNATINDLKFIKFLETHQIKNFDTIKNTHNIVSPREFEEDRNNILFEKVNHLTKQFTNEITQEIFTCGLATAQQLGNSQYPLIAGIQMNNELIIIKRGKEKWNTTNVSTISKKGFTGRVNVWEIKKRENKLLTCVAAVDTDNKLSIISLSHDDKCTIHVLDNLRVNTSTPMTSWQIYEPDGYIIEHLAYLNDERELILFYRSDREIPRTVNLSHKTGETIVSQLTSWQVYNKYNPYPVEESLAGVNKNGELVMFTWSPSRDWYVENLSKVTNQRILSSPTAWINNEAIKIVAIGTDNTPILFFRNITKEWHTIALPNPIDHDDLDVSISLLAGKISYADSALDYILLKSKRNLWVYVGDRDNHWKMIRLFEAQTPSYINSIYSWSDIVEDRILLNVVMMYSLDNDERKCQLRHSSFFFE